MDDWRPISTAPKDGTEIIVGWDSASVWIVRDASWRDGDDWSYTGFESREDAAGWWSSRNSHSQDKLEGSEEPTHWIPMPPPPDAKV